MQYERNSHATFRENLKKNKQTKSRTRLERREREMRKMREMREREKIFSRNLTKVSEAKTKFVGQVLGRH